MTITNPLRCVVYLRISLDQTGEELAVRRQRADCERIAQQRGWTIVEEFVDNSISASDRKKRRPGYDRMVAAYEAGQFDAIVCYDLDRLTRQPRQLEDWIDAAEERGLLLVTANGEADLGTDSGRMYARVKAAVARGEIERKAKRQRDAALQRSQLGRPPLGVRLTGYDSRGQTVPAEADVVRAVFGRFHAGDSLRSLAAWLNDTGFAPRHSAVWNPSSVRTILTNPRYVGRAVYQGKTNGLRGAWTPLVDEDVFDLVQARLADPRRRTQQGTDRKHLGAGLFECGSCREANVEQPRVTSWSGGRYRCPRACLTRAMGPIDAFVLDLIRGALGDPDFDQLIPAQESAQARKVTELVGRLRRRVEQIDADYDRGYIPGARYKSAMAKVEAELSAALALQARLTRTVGAASVLYAANPVAAFDNAPLMIQRNVIDELCTVVLLPGVRGRKTFDSESVPVLWTVGA